MTDYPAEPKSRFEMWWCFGWPYDTSVAMVRMVFNGLLDRYPNLKIITHHLGGMIPFTTAASVPACRCWAAAPATRTIPISSLAQAAAPRLHARLLRRYRAVRRRHPGGALRARVLRRGPRRVRDRHPLGPIAPTIDTIRRLDIADGDRRKIFAGNAQRLLKMNLS